MNLTSSYKGALKTVRSVFWPTLYVSLLCHFALLVNKFNLIYNWAFESCRSYPLACCYFQHSTRSSFQEKWLRTRTVFLSDSFVIRTCRPMLWHRFLPGAVHRLQSFLNEHAKLTETHKERVRLLTTGLRRSSHRVLVSLLSMPRGKQQLVWSRCQWCLIVVRMRP